MLVKGAPCRRFLHIDTFKVFPNMGLIVHNESHPSIHLPDQISNYSTVTFSFYALLSYFVHISIKHLKESLWMLKQRILLILMKKCCCIRPGKNNSPLIYLSYELLQNNNSFKKNQMGHTCIMITLAPEAGISKNIVGCKYWDICSWLKSPHMWYLSCHAW